MGKEEFVKWQITDWVIASKTAAGNRDRGGNTMNLNGSILVNLNYGEKQKLDKADANRVCDDYGYYLYNSLEYDRKYLKKNDFGYKASLLNITIK